MSGILRNRIRLRVQINDQDFYYKSNISVLEACESIGLDIPRFCYHQNLSVAGNCRMCLVEISNTPKPVASCALPISNNIKIYTNTPAVKKARENVLEFLLLNHPLDCPICDQAGECDLQDQAKTFGISQSRYFESKRVVEDKNFNNIIKTVMTRCIHCTRCVRFDSEIAGKEFIGTLNRSSGTEIGSYITMQNSKQFFDSEISGNVIDLCPVGALTSASYAYKTRPWELRTKESIDLADTINAGIYISTKESEIVRVFPKNTNGVSFLSDASRYYFDSNSLNRSLLKNELNLNFFFSTVEDTQSKKKILVLLDKNLDLENLLYIKSINNFIFKFIFNNQTVKLEFKVKSFSSTKNSFNFSINWLSTQISKLDTQSHTCFFFCTDLKIENTILNLKIRLKTKQSFLKIFNFGIPTKTNIKLETLNLSLNLFYKFFEAKNSNSKMLIKLDSPIIVIGEAFYKRGLNEIFFFNTIKKKISSSIILNLKNSLSCFINDFLNVESITNRSFKTIKNIICLNMNDSIYLKKNLNKSNNIVWVNTHNSDMFEKNKNVLFLSSKTEFEEKQIFLNLEQLPQKTTPTLNLEMNFSIKNLFIKSFKINNKFNKVFYNKHLLFLKEMLNNSELLNSIYSKKTISNLLLKTLLIENFFLISYYPFKLQIEDFYLFNKKLKNSLIMQNSSLQNRKKLLNF